MSSGQNRTEWIIAVRVAPCFGEGIARAFESLGYFGPASGRLHRFRGQQPPGWYCYDHLHRSHGTHDPGIQSLTNTPCFWKPTAQQYRGTYLTKTVGTPVTAFEEERKRYNVLSSKNSRQGKRCASMYSCGGIYGEHVAPRLCRARTSVMAGHDYWVC